MTVARSFLQLALFITLQVTQSFAAQRQPNIVFFLADDMGYADLACFGAPDAKTPRIDQLAAEGVKFVNAYAMGA